MKIFKCKFLVDNWGCYITPLRGIKKAIEVINESRRKYE